MVHIVALLGNGWFALVDVLKLMASIRPLEHSLLGPLLLLLHDLLLLLLLNSVATGREIHLIMMIRRETIIDARINKHVMLVLLLLQLLLPRTTLIKRVIIDIWTVSVMVDWVWSWAVAISGETRLTRIGVGIQIVANEGCLQNLTSIHGALHKGRIVDLRALTAYPRLQEWLAILGGATFITHICINLASTFFISQLHYLRLIRSRFFLNKFPIYFL